MTTYNFQQLLFVFSFLIMVIDGTIYQNEIKFNKQIYTQIEMEEKIPYQTMVNMMITNLKENPTHLTKEFLSSLDEIIFTDEEKTKFLKTAYSMAYSDDQMTSSERVFLLLLKNNLKITDSDFFTEFPNYPIGDQVESGDSAFINIFINSLDFNQLKSID